MERNCYKTDNKGFLHFLFFNSRAVAFIANGRVLYLLIMFSKLQILLFASVYSIVMCHLLLKRHIDFRERFLQRRRQRQIIDQRILLLDKYALRNTESLDGIMHYRKIENGSERAKRIKGIETDFRRLIAMEGMKYNYKRDVYWRTWRKVINTKGVEIYVCYKCNNPVQINVTGCQNCGMWVSLT